MTPQEVIQLLDDPATLMRKAYLHIAGGATRTPKLPHLPLPPANGTAQIATFKVEIGHQKVSGFTTGVSGFFGSKKDRPFVKLTKQSGAAKDAGALADDEFNAYYVPMVQTSDVASNRSHYTLPVAAGSLKVMVTSKLSGCTFGVGMNGEGARLVTHVQPDSSIADAGTRATDLADSVGTGFGTLSGKFAKGGGYADMAAVIGRRTGAKWTFYCQASSYADSKYLISGVNKIT